MAELPIDLRSDTVTRPTPEMRRAMAEAEVGDDVYGEDPTVNRLEALAATMVGMEAALFVPSGTMGNQAAVLTHTRRGDEVICHEESHVFLYEVGGMALISGAQVRTLPGRRGFMSPADIAAAIRPENVHFPRTGLLCLENTHNRAGGTVATPDEVGAMAVAARDRGVPVHLDGARIFNAAVALGVPVSEFARHVDSLMFCLSKGLSAPVGSLLCGSRDFIERARRARKVLGGGMRQAGVLAAAGLVALESMVDRLAEDHENARVLAEGLAGLSGLDVDLATVQTNIVSLGVKETGLGAPAFAAACRDRGLLMNAMSPTRVRLVTHKDVDRAAVLRAIEIVAEVIRAS